MFRFALLSLCLVATLTGNSHAGCGGKGPLRKLAAAVFRPFQNGTASTTATCGTCTAGTVTTAAVASPRPLVAACPGGVCPNPAK
jgi:predicted small lipoprotein YifL